MELIDSIVPKIKKEGTLTAGQYLLAFIAGRMTSPVSKNEMQDWFDHIHTSKFSLDV